MSKKSNVVWCYILINQNGKYYTGITNDLLRRLKQHNNNECFSTSGMGRWKYVYTEPFLNYKDARRREVYIKGRGAKRFLNKLNFCVNGTY